MKPTRENMIAAGVLAGVGLYIYAKGASAVGQQLGGAAVGVVDGLIAGTVKGTGSVLGIPDTDQQLCEIACANGQTWEASKFCTAPRFIKYVATGK